MGPFRHSTQPRTLSRLPASVFTSIPGDLRASLSFRSTRTVKSLCQSLAKLRYARPLPSPTATTLDELVSAREATQTLHILRIQDAVGRDAPHTETLRPRLGLAG